MRSLKGNKKGQVEYLLANGFRIGFLIVALLAFFLLINFYINNKIDTQKLQAETLKNRILYSDSIMLSDKDNFRTYTGIVDQKKFNDENLDSTINYGEFARNAAFKLKLYTKPVAGNETFVADAYMNKVQYNNWKEILSLQGKGSAKMFITKHPVTYLGLDDKYHYGTLIIEIIIPNS